VDGTVLAHVDTTHSPVSGLIFHRVQRSRNLQSRIGLEQS
jgi:hypothetical protein